MRGTEAERCVEEARIAYEENRFQDALNHFREATLLGVDPSENAYERWMCLMMLGRFEDAWQETDRTEERRKASGKRAENLPPHLQRVWDGTPVAGKRVLVRCYHGLGDTIQFARYIPMLRRVASAVILEAQDSLAPLLRSVAGIDTILRCGESVDEIGVDVEVELMELPYVFRTRTETIPADVPYVHVGAESAKRRRWEMETFGLATGMLNVGVAWSGGDWNRERNLDLGEIIRLGQVDGVRWFSLQRGEAAKGLREHGWIVNTERPSGTVVDTAAAILALDLVISVDTMVAHLAGALGKPVWVLLPFAADWRWMTERDDSPWYPTMRLFRQEQRRNWKSVIDRVILKLERLRTSQQVRDDQTSCGSGWEVSRSP